MYQNGEKAESSIVTYRDFILTSMNPSTGDNIPSDANKDNRDVVDNSNYHRRPHPCEICYEKVNEVYTLASQEIYEQLVDKCNRHAHTPKYCQLNGPCRFQFPRKLRNATRVIMQEIPFKTLERAGTFRKVKVSLQFATNDSWLNSHSECALKTWCANQDMSILIDKNDCIDYVAKYCTKAEKMSEVRQDIN